MNVIYYIAIVLVMLIVSMIYLARAKELNIYSSFNICARCGTRMMKRIGTTNRMEQVCPTCGCCSDEFGNNL